MLDKSEGLDNNAQPDPDAQAKNQISNQLNRAYDTRDKNLSEEKNKEDLGKEKPNLPEELVPASKFAEPAQTSSPVKLTAGTLRSPKTLGNTDPINRKENVPDINVFGKAEFVVICKASSEIEGWMKSTKAMEIENTGCLVQVTTQQRNPDNSYVVAEALTFVPGVIIRGDQGQRILFKE